MKPGFYAVAAGLLLALARGWFWIGERMRATGERRRGYQFFLGLIGLSISMAELDFGTFEYAPRARSHDGGSSPSTSMSTLCSTSMSTLCSTNTIGYVAKRAPRTRRLGTKLRARDPGSRPHRRSAFGAENPQRIRRLR